MSTESLTLNLPFFTDTIEQIHLLATTHNITAAGITANAITVNQIHSGAFSVSNK